MGRIAILGHFEYEYEYRDAEYEYEKTHEQSDASKSPVGREFESSSFRGDCVIAADRASHRISSYSYSAKRYSVKRYSYSMAVLTAAMPIVDRGGSRELADQ